MSDFRTDDDLWDGGLPEETDDAVGDFDGIDDDLDELGGPPSEFKKGRRSRYKFTMTPQWVLLMTELTHPAFRLYCLMVAHVNTDRGDQLVWPQQKTLAKMLGYKRRASLDPLIKLLVKLELIEVEDKRYGHNNSRRRNVYTVHEEPPANWKGWASIQEFYAAEKAARRAALAAEKKAAAEAGQESKRPTREASAGQDGESPASPRENGTSDGASAAPSNGTAKVPKKPAARKTSGKAPGKNAGKAQVRMTREQAAAVAAVEAAWPDELVQLLPKYRPGAIRDAILEALADGRTADQLVVRVKRRWVTHGYMGDLLPGGKGIEKPVGVAVRLVGPSECPDPMCEDRVLIHTGDACPKCEQRGIDRRADHRAGHVPEPRGERAPGPVWWTCGNEACQQPGKGERPADGMCDTCREAMLAATEQLAAQLAAEEAERRRFADQLAWNGMLEDAYDEHQVREDQAAEARAAAERERKRIADAQENERLREEIRRQHPELAQYAQA